MTLKVAVTGVSSFSGSWIARHLAKSSHQVFGLLSQKKDSYQGIQKIRMDWVGNQIEWVEAVPAESSRMTEWILQTQPEVWIHHHHPMDQYRSLDYSMEKVQRVAIKPLHEIIKALKAVKCKKIVYSGTFFEPGEGKQPLKQSSTPYAQSKYQVWQEIKKQSIDSDLTLSKILIPNPFGPGENMDRLLPLMMRHSIEESIFSIRTPCSKSDFFPISELTKCYQEEVETLEARIMRPSGGSMTVKAFVEMVNQQWIVNTLGWKPVQVQFGSEIGNSYEQDPADFREIHWDHVWKEFYEIYSNWGWHQPDVFMKACLL
ncbi:MAG: hypothetical protein CL678_18590 [Bdellovibrionaceae bacterium]|nr:hypothetical protein [Pseudobdellovibrionaceae bacterium]|tara:strand:+ start:63 stop:1010 length:948 start_codon:yes stop_codon:yes gene_type:complete